MASKTVVCPSCGTKNRIKDSGPGVPHCPKCQAALPWVVDIHDSDFDTVVGESSVPVLVDLWAPWCGPCRVVSPAVEAAGGAYAGRMKVAKLNVDESPRTAGKFQVQGIPTLLMLDHGQEISRQVGAVTGSMLNRWIDQALSKRGGAKEQASFGT